RRPPVSPLCPYTTLFRSRQVLFGCHVADRFLQLLERPHLDLPDALAADTVNVAQLFERARLILEAPLREDMPLARIEALHRAAEDRKSTRLNSSHVKISY